MNNLDRRGLLKHAGAGMGALAAAGLWLPSAAWAQNLPEDRIKSIRYYATPGDAQGRQGQPMVNQSANVVIIETERGLVGIGDGGEPRTMEECANSLIGLDPYRTDAHWQRMVRGMHYVAGREKLHSIGAIDLALWDLKGKALGVPVWQLLGGKTRDHVELYSTGFPRPAGGSLEDAAKACVDAGFQVYRHATDNRTGLVDRFQVVRRTFDECVRLQQTVGDGHWAIDFHTEFDPPDAVRLASMIDGADLHPYFVEDLIRSENPGAYETIRQLTKVPIAVGEQFGYRWDANMLIEKGLINYLRVMLPNCGGITEYMKIVALAETHYVGMIPHFTSPIGEAALVHALCATSTTALMEMLGDGSRVYPYLPQCYDFRDGKLWPNDRPGLGVEVDVSKLRQIGEYTQYAMGMPLNRRPDGSYTQW
jgi:L-alanine-DL-glutamate epimerase-like enolase superfamily enzyme